MHIITRLIALLRGRQLMRQFDIVERSIQALPASGRMKLEALVKREMSRAAQCEFPHLYGTSPEQRYFLWGKGTETGIARVLSENLEVRLRGIALWISVAYHETRESPHPHLQPQHRQLLRILRELKQSSARVAVAERWIGSSAA